MKPKLRPIENQVVVLFGATSGIGLETAQMMAGKGTKVVIVGRNQEGLNQAVERVQQHAQGSLSARKHGNGGRQSAYHHPSGMINVEEGGAPVTEIEEQVMGIEADMTSWEQVKSVADHVMQRFGRIDTWVNIAAVSQWALFEDTNPEEFRRVIEVNLVGHAYGAMAALPYMKQQRGGSLIFVSSVAGRLPIPYQSAYNASKHGLIGLAETLRQELKHTDIPISVTTILPASVNTPLFDKARTKIGVEPEPIPPIYDTKMVARAIVYAAEHRVRELTVGDAGYMANFMRRLAPTLTNNYMGATGFRQQRSNEPKSAHDPDNLYHYTSGHNQVEGDFGHRTMKFSPITWLATHPRARMVLQGALIGGIGYLIGKRIIDARNRRRHSFTYRSRRFGEKAADFLASLPLISSLPMFRRPSLGERLTGWVPDVNLRREKTITDRIKHQRDRLPDHLPLEKERKQAKKRIDRESKLAIRRIEKGREKVIKQLDRGSKQAVGTLRKQRDEVSDRADA
jgi:NAD(P)-dependent dehydrogenase (short-subunit alcohol dehydrogenase family)